MRIHPELLFWDHDIHPCILHLLSYKHSQYLIRYEHLGFNCPFCLYAQIVSFPLDAIIAS